MTTITDRTHWYKKPTRSWYQRAVNTITKIVVHHTADQYEGTDDATLTREANVHYNNDWPGLSYHYFITRTGKIYKINNHSDVTWHDGVNWNSIGVALMGYFHEPVNQQPTQAQLNSLKWLLDHLSTQFPEFPADQDDVYGHREVSATACPGNLFYQKVIDYRQKGGNVTWGGANSGGGSTMDQNITRKASAFDKIVHELFVLGILSQDNSNIYSFEQVWEKIKKEYDEARRLSPKASNWDKICNYLGFENSDNTSFEQVKEKIEKQINAYKGQVSTAQAALAESERKLAVANQEVKNREEQVGRLKDELTNIDTQYLAKIDGLNKTISERDKTIATHESKLEQANSTIDALYKQKGEIEIELAEVRESLNQCESGVIKPGKTLWEAIFEFFNTTRVAGK